MSRISKIVALPLAVLALAALLAGCNTVEGAGKDLQKAGQKIEEKARRAAD